MSGFQPKNIKTRTQRAFVAKRESSGPKRKVFINRLVELLEINPQKDGSGDLLVKENSVLGERFFRVKISPSALERNHKKDEANAAKAAQREWAGCYIDDKMAANIEVGNMLTLEMSYFAGAKQKEGEREVNQLEASWIHTAPEKAKRCIATADSWNGRISTYQIYEEETPDLFNEEDMNEVVRKLNENIKLHNEGVKVPNIGVRFITSRVVDDPKNPEGKKLQYIDTSDTIDWISSEEKGKGSPLDSETFIELVYQYIDYVLGPEDKSSAPLFPEIPEDELKLSVAIYENVLASTKSQSMIIDDTKQFTAAYRMTQTPMRNAQNDEYRLGRNLGATGVLYVSDNKWDKKNKVEIERNLATRFFADSIMGNVISFLRTKDGLKYMPHAALLPLREDQPNGDSAPATGSVKTESKPEQQRTESLATPPVQEAAANAQLSMPVGNTDPFAENFNDDDNVFDVGGSDDEQQEHEEHQEETQEEESKDEGKTTTRRRSF